MKGVWPFFQISGDERMPMQRYGRDERPKIMQPGAAAIFVQFPDYPITRLQADRPSKDRLGSESRPGLQVYVYLVRVHVVWNS